MTGAVLPTLPGTLPLAPIAERLCEGCSDPIGDDPHVFAAGGVDVYHRDPCWRDVTANPAGHGASLAAHVDRSAARRRCRLRVVA